MYLPLNVYRSAAGYDCTNGGVTSKVATIYVEVCDGHYTRQEIHKQAEIDGFDGKPDDLIFTLVNRDGEWHLLPKFPRGSVSFGGNLAASSDGRFRLPARVHDRYLTPADHLGD